MLACLVLWCTGCQRRETVRVREGVEADDRGCVRGVPRLADGVMRGMSVAHAWQNGGTAGYGSASSAASLRELRDQGVDWVSLTPFAFQRTLEDCELRSSADVGGGENEARVRAEIEQAHGLGMHVLLKPHVWVGSGEWCARIAPSAPDGYARWWASYREFLLAWARLAAEAHVEALCVGTELASTVRGDTDAARRLVDEVRTVFPGKLVYAANWDEVDTVPLWPSVDYVGVQLYAPLARRLDESDAAMEARLGASLDRALGAAQRAGKPLLVTEVGYTATRRALLAPHEWPEHLSGREVADVQTQARAYRVAFRAIAARPEIAGVFVWKWFTDPTTTEEGAIGFSPRGRPAAAVMATAYGASRCRDARVERAPAQ